MKFIKLFVIAITALLALACGDTTTVNTPPKPSPAPSTAATPAPTPNPMAVAKEYYADNCSSCHQESGEGGVVKIEGKRLNVPALTKGHALGHSDEQLAKQISNGGDGMPAFKDKLKPDQIRDMVSYVRKEFQGKDAASASQTQENSVSAAPADTKKKMPMDMPKH